MSQVGVWGKGIPSRENRQYKGPEARRCHQRSRNCKAGVARTESASQEERVGCQGRQGRGQTLQSLADTEAFLGMSLEPRKSSQQQRNATFRNGNARPLAAVWGTD